MTFLELVEIQHYLRPLRDLLAHKYHSSVDKITNRETFIMLLEPSSVIGC